MEKFDRPLVSFAEMEALLSGAGTPRAKTVDVYFPLRAVFMFSAVSVWIVRILFNTQEVVIHLSNSVAGGESLLPFIYFRGWFLVFLASIVVYSYRANWYPGLVFGGVFLCSVVNFIFDCFSIYTHQITNPSPLFSISLAVRILIMYLLFVCIKNAGRIPPPKDRWNIFLPWKKQA